MGKTRILIIDDFKDNANCSEDLMSNIRYETYIATSGVEGIKMCEEILPDVVITNILIPKKDGFEIILYLKKHYPTIKIIAVSNGGLLSSS